MKNPENKMYVIAFYLLTAACILTLIAAIANIE